MKRIIVSCISLFFILGCNAGLVDIPELKPVESVGNEKSLSSPSTAVREDVADNNLKISVVKNGKELDLGDEDKVAFELDHSVIEILSLARISEKKSECPSSIKEKIVSEKEKDNVFIICNSYIKRSSLTDVFFEIEGKKIVAKSWVFSKQDEELVELQINL